MRRGWFIALVGTVVLALLVAACGGGSDSGSSSDTSSTGSTGEASTASETSETASEGGGDPIVIGAPIAFTGFVEAYDQPPFTAFKMAVEEANAKGGIDGRQIEIKTADSQSSPEGSGTAAKKLLDQGAEIIVPTCDFDFGSPAALAAQAAGKLAFSLCAASPKWGVQGIGSLAYTAAPAAQTEGVALAQFADERGWRKIGVLLDDTTQYDSAVCDGFSSRAEQLGMEVGTAQTFKQGDKTVQSQVEALRSESPDAVLLCSYPPGAPVALRQIENSGLDVPLLGPVTFDGTYWQEAVPGLSNLYHTAPISIQGDDPDPKVNEFVKKYTKKIGEPPLYSNVAIGYVAAQIIFNAVEETGTTEGAALAEYLDKLKGSEEFLIGPITFTPETHIQCRLPLQIMEISDNKPKYVTTETPEGEIDLGVPGLPCPES